MHNENIIKIILIGLDCVKGTPWEVFRFLSFTVHPNVHWLQTLHDNKIWDLKALNCLLLGSFMYKLPWAT